MAQLDTHSSFCPLLDLWNHHDHVAKTSNFYLVQIILITLTIMIEYPTFDDDHDHDMYSAHVNDDSDD